MEKALVRRRHSAFAAGLATVAMALGFTAIPADAAPPPPRVDLVAIGDSYTAGTGAGPFVPNFPCAQTAGGYVDQLDALPIVDDVANAACHGALLDEVAERGVPSVMQQIADLAKSEGLSGRTELVTLTAGANDIGFNTILFTCAFSTAEACQQAALGARTKLADVQARLAEALTAIHRAAPRARIAVFGYPLLFDPVGGIPVLSTESQNLVNGGTVPDPYPRRASRYSSPARTIGHSCSRMENTTVSRRSPSRVLEWLRSTPSCFAPSRAIASRDW
jgi:lysophospholipase L1-like esterase